MISCSGVSASNFFPAPPQIRLSRWVAIFLIHVILVLQVSILHIRIPTHPVSLFRSSSISSTATQVSEQLLDMTAIFLRSCLTPGRLRILWSRSFLPLLSYLVHFLSHSAELVTTHSPNIPTFRSNVRHHSARMSLVWKILGRTQLTSMQLPHVLNRILCRVPFVTARNT